jgi:hypothetical protein
LKTKRCSRKYCENPLTENGVLPVFQFYKRKEGKDGLRPECKWCSNKKYRTDESYRRKLLDSQKAYSKIHVLKIMARVAKWNKENPEKRKKWLKKYNSNPNVIKKHRDWYKANKKQHQAVGKLWDKNNAEKSREIKRRWKQKNPERVAADNINRRALLHKATPKWAVEMMKDYVPLLIKFRNALTKATGNKYVIDHHVPLKGRGFTGLHVPWNLRLITEKENLEKNNKTPLEFAA